LDDCESVLEFAEEVDAISYEIKGVSVEALRELEKFGKPVLPATGISAGIRDKYLQKELFREAGIPTARCALVRIEETTPVPTPKAETALAVAEAARVFGGVWPMLALGMALRDRGCSIRASPITTFPSSRRE
jgi:phosphoribosylaminoimidazole carboxylase (NCAIR synthetase)